MNMTYTCDLVTASAIGICVPLPPKRYGAYNLNHFSQYG